MQKQIENLLSNINNNTKTINSLLIEKKKVMCRLYTTLELKRHGKIALEERQIDAFSRFMNYYKDEQRNINEQLGQIYHKKGFSMENGILHTYSNYELLSKDLDSFNEWQSDVLKKLTKVVEEGEGVLRKIEGRG